MAYGDYTHHNGGGCGCFLIFLFYAFIFILGGISRCTRSMINGEIKLPRLGSSHVSGGTGSYGTSNGANVQYQQSTTPKYNDNTQDYTNSNPNKTEIGSGNTNSSNSYQYSSPNNTQSQPTLKYRTITYEQQCSYCNGSGVVICPICRGSGFTKRTCDFCNGTGGKRRVACFYCRNGLTSPGTYCITCGGSGYTEESCMSCGGSGYHSDVCQNCDFMKHTVTCSHCKGWGEVTMERYEPYYEY